MINSKSIGDKITKARKKMNLSQAELAEHISISPQAVGKWERGESMPDIMTLNRLAEIFGVDLNYFSENFQSTGNGTKSVDAIDSGIFETPSMKKKKNVHQNWNMSNGNWVDADFSGLKNLADKFSSSNIKNCKFLDSDLSELILKSNYIDSCDFSNSDFRNSKIHHSFLTKTIFAGTSLIDANFTGSEINNCDFSNADFSGIEFVNTSFQHNKIGDVNFNHASFKETSLYDLTFNGTIEDCSFENCGFSKVKFQNATILNTFFKNNRKFKKVEFVNCKVDKITYGFLINNQANVTGVEVIE